MSHQFDDKKTSEETKKLQEFLESPITIDATTDGLGYHRLAKDVDLALHYNQQIPIGRAPYFHPYHPFENAEPSEVLLHQGLNSIIMLKLPIAAFSHLPMPLLEHMKRLAEKDKTDIYFIVQNMPFKGQQVLFRPHYWIHGDKNNDASFKNFTFNVDTRSYIGLFNATNPNLSLDNIKNDGTSSPVQAVSHASGDRMNMMVCSPDNVGILRGLNLEKSESFYSTVRVSGGSRNAVTLHWLLNESDENKIAKLSLNPNIKTVKDLIQGLSNLPHSSLTAEPVKQLMSLLNVQAQDLKKGPVEKKPTTMPLSG